MRDVNPFINFKKSLDDVAKEQKETIFGLTSSNNVQPGRSNMFKSFLGNKEESR